MRWAVLAVTSVLAIGASGLLVAWLRTDPGPDPAAAAAPELKQPRVTLGNRYYVLLAVVEVAADTGQGRRWDVDDSAPDLDYQIWWRGTRVFESSPKKDSLVGKWSNAAVDWRGLVGELSVDDSMRAARFTARPNDALRFVVRDRDFGRREVVGEWTVASQTLRIGDQTWTRPGGRVLSATCRVIPLDEVELDALVR